MFTDSEATPARVEMLLELVRSMRDSKLDSSTIRQLLQPEGLPARTSKSDQAGRAITAARELDLIVDQAGGTIHANPARDNRSARAAVVEAVDDKVLRDDKIEPWFALFYAFLLGRDESAAAGNEAGEQWEARFQRELFGAAKQPNRFNDSKYRGFRRWFRYCGLGWHDGEDCFHPNPYERVARQLPAIFSQEHDLPIDSFMQRLSERCPELDGGDLFLRANPNWNRSARTISLGLSHAFVDLHLDGVLVLNCPLDGDGWSIAKAAPPRDGNRLKADLVSSVAYAPTRGARSNG